MTFTDPSVAETTASFTLPGVYVLRLTASDGELSTYDEINVFVNTLDLQVSASSDDAEETPSGSMELLSPDLDLGDRIVGIRFSPVDVPHGPLIVDILQAQVQFQADKTNSTPTLITIEGDDTGSAPAFSESNGNITSRERTAAAVAWSPPAWTAGDAGADQLTPDLAPILQEIVSRPDWVGGNPIALVFSGVGLREAKSFDRHSAPAALLHLEFGVEPCVEEIEELSGLVATGEELYRNCVALAASDFEILGPGGNVTFAAGERIILREGFVVRSEGKFVAVIDPQLLP